jgi:hypothetical protein
MATFKVHESLTWACEAGADLTGSLNRLVKLQADGTVVLAGSAEKALGPIIEVPLSATAGRYGPASIQIGGIAKISAAGAIPAGTRVQATTNGQITPGTTNPVGVTLETAGAANVLVAVAMIG